MRVGGIPPPSYSKPGPVARLRQRRLQSHQQNPPRRSTQPRNFEVGYYKLFQNWVQALNSEVVGLTEMRDKQGQQRRWRADGAIRSSVDRRPMGEGPALASSSTFATTRRTATGLRPQGARRPFVDSAQRRSLAGFARRVPLASHVLAQTARLGRARCLAPYLAGVSSRTQRTEATAVERVFPGREFCSRQKRGAGVGKTKRGKGTKWMVVVDGQGLPLGKHLCSASPHETQLAETTLATICVGRRTHAGR